MLKKQYSKSKPVCKVTFTLPKAAAAKAKEIKVLGTFNGWSAAEAITMKASTKEYKAVIELPVGQNYEFRYLIDGKTWENHWAADAYVPSPFGVDNSVVHVAEVLDAAKTVKTRTQKSKKGDDLRKIEGVGLKIAGLLQEAGIQSFDDLAKAKQSELQAILTAAGNRFKMHNPSTWAEQAQLAATGNWDKLAALQAQLDGGKRK